MKRIPIFLLALALVFYSIIPSRAAFLGCTITRNEQIRDSTTTVIGYLFEGTITDDATTETKTFSYTIGGTEFTNLPAAGLPTVFVPSATYVLRQYVGPTTPNGHTYIVTVAGTASTEPAWCTVAVCLNTSGAASFREAIAPTPRSAEIRAILAREINKTFNAWVADRSTRNAAPIVSPPTAFLPSVSINNPTVLPAP